MDSVKRVIVDELHAPVRINFPRRKTVQKGVGETLQGDVIVMSSFKKENRGFTHALTVIDTFSKYAFVRPLKTKSGQEVAKAFEDILKSYKYTKFTKWYCCDKGSEFLNTHFR